MLKEAADELLGCQRHSTEFVGIACTVAYRDPVRPVTQDGLVGDGDAVDVTSQVGQGLPASADGLGMHDPTLLFPDVRFDDGKDVGIALPKRIP